MKVFGITVSLLLASSCSAFAPSSSSSTSTSRTQPLYAKTLEGWKVDGTVKPVGNFILVKKAEVESQTDTGILLSESSKVVKTEGRVVEVGPGKLHPDSGIPYPTPVSVGDGLIYGKFDGTEISIDGIAHSLIRDDDILVKFDVGGGDGDGDGEDATVTVTEDNVEAVNEGVLVFVETRELATSGGLLLGSSSSSDGSKRPSTGVVVKVGPGRMAASGDMIPMNVEVGDQVKFMDFAGNEIKIGDKEYSVVKMPEILAKF